MAHARIVRRSTLSVLVLASLLAASSRADAQIRVTTWTPIQEGPAVTAVLGKAGAGGASASAAHAVREIATRIDTPVDSRHLVRLEAAKAAWRFEGTRYVQEPMSCCPGVLTSVPAGTISDRVAITRITASLIRRHIQSVRGEWTPFYAGGGIGAYHYEPTTSAPYSRPWRFGIHGLAGLEIPIPGRRIAIGAEVQLHMPGVPPNTAVPGNWFSIASASLGMKIRM